MHYELYIDVFFLENFAMDFILLAVVRKGRATARQVRSAPKSAPRQTLQYASLFPSILRTQTVCALRKPLFGAGSRQLLYRIWYLEFGGVLRKAE